MRTIDYQTYQRPTHFLKLEQGDNRVRIVSKGVICYEHGLVLSNGKYIPMGVCTEDSKCPQCKKGNVAKLRYKWVVYSPKTGDMKVLAVGIQVGDEICVIGKQDERLSFEVIIHRTGIGKKTQYKVKRVPPTKVDEETAVIIKENSDYLFSKYLAI